MINIKMYKNKLRPSMYLKVKFSSYMSQKEENLTKIKYNNKST